MGLIRFWGTPGGNGQFALHEDAALASAIPAALADPYRMVGGVTAWHNIDETTSADQIGSNIRGS